MTSKNRYFFAQYNEDPLRHDEIVLGIGRSVGLSKRVKTFGNVLCCLQDFLKIIRYQ